MIRAAECNAAAKVADHIALQTPYPISTGLSAHIPAPQIVPRAVISFP